MTTNQARDQILDANFLTTETIREIKNLAQKANDDRKSDSQTYVRCPRCFGHHSVHGNFDGLCDGCQQTILEYFPNHESVQHIKAALAKRASQ